MTGVTIAIAGLGFGQEFVPIYLSHPDVNTVVLVEPDNDCRADVAHRYNLETGYADLSDALDDDKIDAVHILSPVHTHADMTVASLNAGKHVASAVPMATTLEDLDRIIAAQQHAEQNYMMMETTVFAREYRYINQMYQRGEMGPLTLYRGFHIQQLDGFPSYWQGFPPMHYVTHALSPALALLKTSAQSVHCHGAGTLTPGRRTGGFDNTYPAEVGLFTLRDSDVIADITMSFFQTARTYIEGFALYGEKLGIEWPTDNQGPLTIHDMAGPANGTRGNHVTQRDEDPADMVESLPEALQKFVRPSSVQLPGMPRPTHVGAGHGGSHPFLADEFIASIIQDRPPEIDTHTAARWTAPGICAHQSAMSNGAQINIPNY